MRPSDNKKERDKLQAQVDEYLNNGGEITEIPYGEGADIVATRSRKEQVEWLRNRFKIKGGRIRLQDE